MENDQRRAEVGHRLRNLRGTKSREEMARDLGVTAQAIWNYENAFRTPGDDLKIKMAEYFGKTVQEIFFDRGSTE